MADELDTFLRKNELLIVENEKLDAMNSNSTTLDFC
jgi:hypothetical protein